MRNPAGSAFALNQACAKAAWIVASVPFVSSKNTADLPAGSEETPRSGTALPAEWELSSIFQPVRSTAVVPLFVSSNQSAVYGALPLPHGATSVITIDDGGGGGVEPPPASPSGDPVSPSG